MDYPKVQKAIDAATSGDTVLVFPGLFVESLNLHGKNIRLRSSEGAYATILEPATARLPVVTFESGEDSLCVLEHLTLRAARDTVAILCSGTGPIIQHCVIVDCRNSWVGAAIKCNNRATPVIRFNEFQDNEALIGAAVYVDGYSDAEVAYNWIHDNTGGRPGISVSKGTAYIHHNLLHDNRGSSGWWWEDAAIWVQSGGSRVLNNTLVRNSVGIYANSGASLVLNNIVVSCGDGIYNDGSSLVGYNDVWNNGYSNDGGTGGISSNPKFVDTLSDFSLSSGSPCINKGHPDLKYLDPDGSRNDMGALPYAGFPPWPPTRLFPGGDSILAHVYPVFVWAPSEDANREDQIRYDFRLSSDSLFSSPWIVTGVDTNAVVDTFSLELGRRYWWQVIARDQTGWAAPSSIERFRTYLPGDANGSLNVSTSDVVELVNVVFHNKPFTVPLCAVDMDGSGMIGVPDITLLVDFVFKGQPEPIARCH